MIICNLCQKKIVDEEYSRAGVLYYHLNCSKCRHCSAILVEKELREKRGEIYCPECFILAKQPTCGTCKEPVYQEYIEAMGVYYHKEHFLCKICTVDLDGKYQKLNGNPVCAKCYSESQENKCEKCSKYVEDKRVVLDGKIWHPECLSCQFCKLNIKNGQIVNQKDGIFHFKCFNDNLAPLCAFCKSTITGPFLLSRSTNEKIHKECLQFFLKKNSAF